MLEADDEADLAAPDYITRAGPMVLTDGLRLRQIVINLIGNAVKFTETGTVHVRYQTSTTQLHIRVKDTGMGISARRLEDIFQPFTQGENPSPRRFGGTGLGLSISRQLAERLGGFIDVESEPGMGSTFTLTLPTTLVEPPETIKPAAKPLLPEDLPQSARILLAEDHDVNRLLVTEMLERCGQSVETAHDGHEAIAMVMDSLVRAKPYDLVLMDVQMPGCDGYTATRALREDGPGEDTLPILALTANAFPEDIEAAVEAGMQGHLAKPIAFADLVRALERWLPTRIVEAPMDRDVPTFPANEPIPVEAYASCLENEDDTSSGASSGASSLRERWLARRAETIASVRAALQSGLLTDQKRRRATDQDDQARLYHSLHKLSGAAGSFGESDLGDAAQRLERALREGAAAAHCEALALELIAMADTPHKALPAPSRSTP